jgi:hypothetical protein
MSCESSVMFDEAHRRKTSEELNRRHSLFKKAYASEEATETKDAIMVKMAVCKEYIPLFSVKDSVVILTKSDIYTLNDLLIND